jgi:hypothetical protein
MIKVSSTPSSSRVHGEKSETACRDFRRSDLRLRDAVTMANLHSPLLTASVIVVEPKNEGNLHD